MRYSKAVRRIAASPFLGPVFEGFIASEIAKHRLNRGRPHGLYYFRDHQGLEVDFVVDEGNRRLTLLEAKATRTPMPDAARPLARLAGSVKNYETAAFLVHAGKGRHAGPITLYPGVKAIGAARLNGILS